MKKYVLALLCVWGFASLSMAQSSSVALKMGYPFLFSVGYGYDFNAPNQGFGVRGYFGATATGGPSVVGLGVDGLLRAPVGDSGSNAFIGVGAAGILNTSSDLGGFYFSGNGVYLYLLAGFEITLGQNWGLMLEWQPIQLFVTQSKQGLQTIPLISVGVNYRF